MDIAGADLDLKQPRYGRTAIHMAGGAGDADRFKDESFGKLGNAGGLSDDQIIVNTRGEINGDAGRFKMENGDINTIGNLVKCGTEYFYIMPDHELAPEGTISMLAVVFLPDMLMKKTKKETKEEA